MNIITYLKRIQIILPILAIVSNIFLIFIASVSFVLAKEVRFSYFKYDLVYLFFFSSFITLFLTTLLINLTALIKQNYSLADSVTLLVLDLLLVLFLIAFITISSVYNANDLVLVYSLPISGLAFIFNLIHLTLVSIHFKNSAANKN